jgi:hypothetical protein
LRRWSVARVLVDDGEGSARVWTLDHGAAKEKVKILKEKEKGKRNVDSLPPGVFIPPGGDRR